MRGRIGLVSAVVAVVVAVVVMVLLLASRGGGGRPAASAPVPRFDPPHRFDPGLAVDLPREADGDPPPVALDGFTAHVAIPGRLRVIDTRTGAVRAEQAPQASPAGPVPRAPVLGRIGDRDAVVAAFAVAIPGHGTTVGHDAVELVVLARDSFEPLPGLRVDLPPMLEDAGRLRSASVLAVTGDVAVVVVEVGPDREPATYAVDVRSGAVRWRAPGLAAVYPEGRLLIGVLRAPGGSRVAAVSAADGRPVWTGGGTGENVTVARGGRALAAAVSVAAGSGQRVLTFYETATGRARTRRAVPGGVTCRFDDRLTTVCWNADAGQPWAAGFDATTARTVWELPDAAAGRVAPRVTTVWHGAVYGTTDNGPVVLRAPTGQDWAGPSLSVAPDLVNEVVGVVGATIDRPRPRVYRAVA
jgi:hypothetical protein